MSDEGTEPGIVPGADQVQPPLVQPEPDRSPDADGGQRNFRAALQQRWDSNPILVGLGIAFTAVTVVLTLGVPVVGFIRDNDLASANSRLEAERLAHQEDVSRLQGQVDGLQQSLGSIRLAIGPDTDFFDATGLVVQRETLNEVPAESASYDSGRFFGPAAGGSTWTYDETSELHSTAETYGMTDEEFRDGYGAALTQNGLPEAQVELLMQGMDDLVVHRWQMDGEKLIEGPGVRFNMPTQVQVERVDHDHFLELIFGQAQTEEQQAVQSDLYGRDESGWILQSQLLTRQLSGQFPLINTLQKKGDIAYAAIETPVFDVTVNGEAFDEFVIHEDFLIISTPTDAYLVRRMVADEGRSPDSADLNQWLDQFRVCENC